jgi:glycosyltransferase involved in cell wall biosynthesis
MNKIAVSLNYVLGGPYVYSRELLIHLSRLNRKFEYIGIADKKDLPEEELKSITIKSFSMRHKFWTPFWDQVYLPISLMKNKADLFHHTKSSYPVCSRIPVVSTIHDMAPFLFDDCFAFGQKQYLKMNYQLIAKKADRLIAVSSSTKNDMVRLLKAKEEKIEVIYHGVSSKIQRVENINIIQRVKTKYNLPEHYILYLGTVQLRKNIALLIQCFLKLRKNQNLPHFLILAGRLGWQRKEVSKILSICNCEGIQYIGCVEEEDKSALYSGADCFVSPSLYEGFGLTILEAMKCGTPVIASNISSIPEVTGDAALLIDPMSENELYEALKLVLGSESVRKKLSEKAIIQSASFNREKTALETEKV